MIESVNIQPTHKLPQRQFLPLVLLGMLLVALLLIGQWLWLTRTLSAPAPQMLLPAERAPLLTSLFRQPGIVWSLIASAVTMMLALLAAVSPLSWWAQFHALFSGTPGVKAAHNAWRGQEPQSAEEWVAAQAALLGVPPTALPLDPMSTLQPGQPLAVPLAPGQPQQPGAPPVPGQPRALPAPGQQPQPGQQAGTPGQAQQPGTPGQPQQPGTPLTPEQQLQRGQQPAPQPGAPPGQPAPAPQPPQPGLQPLLAPEENMDLKELTNIGDILSSFKDNDDIPAQLLALSESLDDVEIEALVAHSRRVARHLAATTSAASRQVSRKSAIKLADH